jgi:multicomponent Na+:H+ antiporter subunit G
VNAGQAIASVFMLAGCALALVAGIGVVRLPDVFARMHAATKPATLGLLLVCIGAAVADATLTDVAKLGLVVVLQFLTAPVGAHMVGRAAYGAGLLHGGTVLDELATAPNGGQGDDAGPATAT